MEGRCRKLQQSQGRRRADRIRFKWREGRSAPNTMYRYSDACPNGKKVHVYVWDSNHINFMPTILPVATGLRYSDCSVVIIKILLTTIAGAMALIIAGMISAHQCQPNMSMQLHFLLDCICQWLLLEERRLEKWWFTWLKWWTLRAASGQLLLISLNH